MNMGEYGVEFSGDSHEKESVRKLVEAMGIPCMVCPNKLKEEKNLKFHMKLIHYRIESVLKVLEVMRSK